MLTRLFATFSSVFTIQRFLLVVKFLLLHNRSLGLINVFLSKPFCCRFLHRIEAAAPHCKMFPHPFPLCLRLISFRLEPLSKQRRKSIKIPSSHATSFRHLFPVSSLTRYQEPPCGKINVPGLCFCNPDQSGTPLTS